MCLYINKERTRRVKQTFKKNGGKCTMWKMFWVKEHIRDLGVGLVSPFMDYIYLSGYTYSDRPSKELDKIENKYQEIEEGIHVFTNKKAALKSKEKLWGGSHDDCVIVPVTVLEKDFIAAGRCDAVFMKVYISAEDYNKPIEEFKERENYE